MADETDWERKLRSVITDEKDKEDEIKKAAKALRNWETKVKGAKDDDDEVMDAEVIGENIEDEIFDEYKNVRKQEEELRKLEKHVRNELKGLETDAENIREELRDLINRIENIKGSVRYDDEEIDNIIQEAQDLYKRGINFLEGMDEVSEELEGLGEGNVLETDELKKLAELTEYEGEILEVIDHEVDQTVVDDAEKEEKALINLLKEENRMYEGDMKEEKVNIQDFRTLVENYGKEVELLEEILEDELPQLIKELKELAAELGEEAQSEQVPDSEADRLNNLSRLINKTAKNMSGFKQKGEEHIGKEKDKLAKAKEFGESAKKAYGDVKEIGGQAEGITKDLSKKSPLPKSEGGYRIVVYIVAVLVLVGVGFLVL